MRAQGEVSARHAGIRSGVAGKAAKDARRAREEGLGTFAYRIRQDWKDNGSLSRELDNVPLIIDSIEREGWALQHVSYYGNERKPSGVYIFRTAYR